MEIINFFGNPNIGLFFYSTDKFTIAPRLTDEAVVKAIKRELKTEVIKLDVMSSSVNAIFLAGNEKIIIVPKGISNESKNEIEKLGVKVAEIDTKFNALGNNVVICNNKAIVNPNFEESAVKQIEALGFNVKKLKIAGVETVGANLVVFGKKGIINKTAKDNEIRSIEEFLGIELERGTVNGGSPIIKAGFVKNSSGILVSEDMRGPEIMMLEGLMK